MRVGYGRQAVPRRLGFVLVFIALLPAATALAAAPGTWSPTGSLPSGAGLASREATLVPNGHVLVVHATYDPASGTWTPSNALQGLLLPNGTVLSGTSVYDPSTDTVSSTGPLPMSGYLISALLPDGRVLAVGGFYPGDPPRPNGAALYDPASNTWSRTNGLTQFRLGFSPPDSATLLPNGKILVSGGGGSGGLANAELYDPSTGTWLASSAGQTVHATAVLLANGKVLFTSLGAQLYDPATDTWSVTSGMPVDQFFPPATLLPNGTVLVAGGGFRASTDASLYDPASGTWRPTGSMTTPRIGPAQTLLRDGTTLAVGGSDGSVILTSAELYTPPTAEVVPPSCALSDAGLDSSGHAFIKVAARDIFSGLNSIQVLEATNANVALPRFPPGLSRPRCGHGHQAQSSAALHARAPGHYPRRPDDHV